MEGRQPFSHSHSFHKRIKPKFGGSQNLKAKELIDDKENIDETFLFSWIFFLSSVLIFFEKCPSTINMVGTTTMDVLAFIK